MSKLFLLLFSVLIFSSCAKTDEEAIDSAIQEAKYHLSVNDCSSALSALQEVDFQTDNAFYIGVYASAQACGGGYDILGDGRGKIATLDATSGGLFGSLAVMSLPVETSADSTNYVAILAAINTLLEAGGGAQPSAANRITEFGTRKGTDLNMQALFLVMIELGKFVAYYANTDAAGIKGGGSTNADTNVCFGEYTFDADVNTQLGLSALGNCNNATSGHTDLKSPVAAATIKTRLCEGIVLFNNFLDILDNITLSSNSSLGDLSSVGTVLNGIFTLAATAEASASWGGSAVTTIQSITSQTTCEAQSDADLQRYYVLIMESNMTST